MATRNFARVHLETCLCAWHTTFVICFFIGSSSHTFDISQTTNQPATLTPWIAHQRIGENLRIHVHVIAKSMYMCVDGGFYSCTATTWISSFTTLVKPLNLLQLYSVLATISYVRPLYPMVGLAPGLRVTRHLSKVCHPYLQERIL